MLLTYTLIKYIEIIKYCNLNIYCKLRMLQLENTSDCKYFCSQKIKYILIINIETVSTACDISH